MAVPGQRTTWTVLAAFVLLAMTGAVASAVVKPAAPPVTPRPSATPSTFSGQPLRTTVPLSPPASPPTTQPLPDSEGVTAVAFFNAEHGYGLFHEVTDGNCGEAVAETWDGGATFSTRVPVAPASPCYGPSTGASFGSISFDNHGDGFVYGPDLYVTHDGGATWSAESAFNPVSGVIPLGFSVWALHGSCVNTSPAPTCSYGVEESRDGGRSWTDHLLPGAGSGTLYSDLVRVSTSSAVMIGESSSTPSGVQLLATTDSGDTWHVRSAAPCVGNGWTAYLSQAPDGTLWVVCGGQPSAGNQLKTVARSSDGGRTWMQGPCHLAVTDSTLPGCLITDGMTSGYLGDAWALSSTTAFTGGGRTFLKVTHDGGLSWSLTTPVVGDGDLTVAGLYFADSLDGWVVPGEGTGRGTLWHTTDGGDTWFQLWPVDIAASNCTSAQLRIKVGAPLSSIGTEGYVLTFTNVSSNTCQLGGFPSVVAVDTTGKQVAAMESQGFPPVGGVADGGPLPLVRLEPGGVASAVVQAESEPDPGGAPCGNNSYLLVTAPWGTAAARLSAELPGLGHSLPACGQQPSVTEIVPGSTGSA